MSGSKGVQISVFGCHNPETWDFKGGYEIDYEKMKEKVLLKLNENNVQRNLSLLGGEPLCEENLEYALDLLAAAKQKYPNIHTFVWTGFTYENLLAKYGKQIFKNIDTLIDGPFILAQRDLTLELRGSRNQRILRRGVDF